MADTMSLDSNENVTKDFTTDTRDIQINELEQNSKELSNDGIPDETEPLKEPCDAKTDLTVASADSAGIRTSLDRRLSEVSSSIDENTQSSINDGDDDEELNDDDNADDDTSSLKSSEPSFKIPTTFDPSKSAIKSLLSDLSESKTETRKVTSSGTKVKKTRRRGSAWSDDETEFLLEIWARQVELVKDRGGDETATCTAVYRLIASEMEKHLYDKSWEQCKTRIHTLKRAYKITKDEINSGAKTITYCRHYDKLGIISGDNPDISPGVLAATLADKRRKTEAENKPRVKLPVKRKLPVGEPPAVVKRPAAPPCPPLPSFSTFAHSSSVTPNSVTSLWQPSQDNLCQTQTGQKTQSILQQSLSTPVKSPLASFPYHSLTSATQNMQEINNNQTPIKSEKTETSFHEQSGQTNLSSSSQWNSFTPLSHGKSLQQGQRQEGQADLERMRIGLEMKKLEVERNKIEMEERQRREERDHQYRMMQLLLFGLGQQNIPQLLNAQGSEVAHAHNTDWSRALESGLVPGGQQKVNEKGLSFSEL